MERGTTGLPKIKLDILWSLFRNNDSWLIYVNYIPQFEKKELRDLFYHDELHSGRKKIPVKRYNLTHDINDLSREIESHIVRTLSYEIEQSIIKPKIRLIFINHSVTNSWVAKAKDTTKINWRLRYFVGNKP